jgi:predicted MFS family arabinose efflux permease
MGVDYRSDLPVEARSSSRSLVPILGLSVFSVWLIAIMFQLLLIDIAKNFNINVGIAGQVASISALAGIVAGLLTSIFSTRFSPKPFLIVGLTSTCLSAVGLFFAPTFYIVLIMSAGVGTGIALVTAMAYSCVGDFLPLKERGRAMGWLVACSTLAAVFGAPLIGLIANNGNWRSVTILLALPFALVSLVLVFFAIPKGSIKHSHSIREPFFAGCKQVFARRSAIACLFVTMFVISEASIAFYTVSFFRSQFSVSLETGALVVLINNCLFALGCIMAGFFVNRIGRKPLGIFACSITVLLALTFTFMPNFTLSWVMSSVRFWFVGMAISTLNSLVIEQTSKFRSTMAALNTTFFNVGTLFASITGGVALRFYNYQTMTLVLGGFTLIGLFIWVALVDDPTKARGNSQYNLEASVNNL